MSIDLFAPAEILSFNNRTLFFLTIIHLVLIYIILIMQLYLILTIRNSRIKGKYITTSLLVLLSKYLL